MAEPKVDPSTSISDLPLTTLPSPPITLTAEELERELQSVDPAVRLLPPRILRRVIKRVGRIPGLGLQVPHRKSVVCTSSAFVRAVDSEEWNGPTRAPLPDVLILLPRPRPDGLARRSRQDVLLKYWRLLFHAHVHRALDQKAAEGQLSEQDVQYRIRELDANSFDEIRQVLVQEKYLLGNASDGEVYREFAAVYLEFRHLAPALLPWYFPSLKSQASVDALLARDIDAAAVLARTRPPGVTEPSALQQAAEAFPEAVAGIHARAPASPPPAETSQAAVSVRQAPLSPRGRGAGGEGAAVSQGLPLTPTPLPRGERGFSDRLLVQGLRRALHLGEAETDAWTHLLVRLTDLAAGGAWSQERRLLYDLQNVCLDADREVYALDLVEWALSLGKRPIRRLLPGQGAVLALKHLRRAVARLPALDLPVPQRFALAALLESALHGAEHRLRDRFRPLIAQTLDQVGLCPNDFPERGARQKLIEELLDRITERGFLNMGDVRDALSRNQLKLPDLWFSRQLGRGDPLIEANRRFSVSLDGVYQHGEIYLRALQRLSSLAFGTSPGRWLTRFVALPVGGAFLILEGLQHIIDPVAKLFAETPAPIENSATELANMEPDADSFDSFSADVAEDSHSGIHLLNAYSLIGLSFFLLALLHVPSFRASVVRALKGAARGFAWLVVELPQIMLQQRLVRSLLQSPPFVWIKQFLLKPLLWTVPVAILLAVFSTNRFAWVGGSSAWFVGVAVLLNTRLGRDLEESATDWLARLWKQIHSDFLPSIFYWIMGVFKRCVETSERILYAVDEWLRFRAGDGRWALIVKPALGLAWFFATYLIRIFIHLFVEPTVNPIKHFPVVTVAAKLIVPIIPALGGFLMAQCEPLTGRATARVIAALVIFFLPGLAGFLVWEFKENWKLYRANRSPSLRPVVIGHHGETMLRLLRPGLHSGTIPKQFAKLRRSLRRAQRTGRWRSYRKQRLQLREVEQAVRHFLEREFLFLLNESKCWNAPHVCLGAIDLATNQFEVELVCSGLSPAPARIAFGSRHGSLQASTLDNGWLQSLSEPQRRLVGVALAGTYKLGGIDLVSGPGEQIQRVDTVDIPWLLWVETWEQEEAGKELPQMFTNGKPASLAI